MTYRFNSPFALGALVLVAAYLLFVRVGHVRSLERDGEGAIKMYLARKEVRKAHPQDKARLLASELNSELRDQLNEEARPIAEQMRIDRLAVRRDYTRGLGAGRTSYLTVAVSYSQGKGPQDVVYLVMSLSPKEGWEVLHEIGHFDFFFGDFCRPLETRFFPPCISTSKFY